MTKQPGMHAPVQVLLIEDNAGDVRLIKEMLHESQMFPCELEYSHSLSGGLELLSNKKFSAVLLDIGLPDGNGLDSIQEVRNLAPNAPIVILTGLDDEEAAVSSLKFGAQDYLVKGQIDSNLLARSLRYARERWQAGEALQKKQHLLQRIADTTPNILFILDIKDHALIYANRELKNTLGYTQDDVRLMGEGIYEKIVHPEDLPYLNMKARAIAKADDNTTIDIELRMKHANGSWLWISGRNVVFSRDGDGRTREILGAARDITEQKKVEEELLKHREYLMELVEERTKELQWSNLSLQAANELLENVFANVHVLIAYMDMDFNFIKVNTKYAEANGSSPEFFIGKNHFDLYPNEENEAIFRNVVETGKSLFVRAKPFTHPYHNEKGTTFWDWSLSPVIDTAGKKLGLILSLIDVTDNIMLYGELMRAEHLASIGRLAAGVAHEINNPINGIINYAQILSNRSEQGSKEKDIAGRIIKESDRIAGIVSSLLSFSRDNKGAKAPVSLREIIDDALALTETQLKKQGIKINLDLPPDLCRIYANKQQIEQILLNMISNARYALKQKYPEDHSDKIINISCANLIKEGVPNVRIIFYDSGAGISQEIIDKITDPFFSTKPEGEGTGLGLSICHGIVMDHNGSLKIESREGEFTRIIIDLPAAGKFTEA
ncbi:MAG: PAS domain S-box protein [Nitrospirae bacterium]|nr:PAS domain S-box protein [Nitrospirota bacterium]